jgi:hypothetical protein
MLSYVVLIPYHFFHSLSPVQNILKKHRFDMPPGVENNPADMQKITAAHSLKTAPLPRKRSALSAPHRDVLGLA